MRELSAFYGGTGGLSKNAKDENLRRWFAKLSLEVDKLSHDDPVVAARTIKELETALIEGGAISSDRGQYSRQAVLV
jgi:hypothetical protein